MNATSFTPARPHFFGTERVIKSHRIVTSQKFFELSLRENQHGKFVKIVEGWVDSNRVVSKTIVPLDGINEFIQALQQITMP